MARRVSTLGSAAIWSVALYGALASFTLASDVCDEAVVYHAEERNLTGVRHRLGMEEIDEVAWFDGFDLLIRSRGGISRYRTIGGGTGIQQRLAIRVEGEGGDQLVYMFYDLTGHNAAGTPDHFLLIAGDLYWPRCEASAPE